MMTLDYKGGRGVKNLGKSNYVNMNASNYVFRKLLSIKFVFFLLKMF